MRTSHKPIVATALVVLLTGATLQAQAQSQPKPDEARVISSTPIIEPASAAYGKESRTVGYTVTYEFGGRRYTTQMSQPPGATIPVQVSPMGVMTSAAPQPEAPRRQGDAAWQNVVPEAGVVDSGEGAMAVAAPYAQPTYYAPAYAYGAPVYAAPYGYGYGYAPTYYPSPFYGAPIGLSLNLGYSRGWGGGGRGRWR